MQATSTTRRAVAVLAALVLGAAFAPAPAYAEPLIRIETVTSAVDTQPKSVTAHCPDGLWLLAVGGWITNNNGRVLLTSLKPEPDLVSATVAARNRSDSNAAFSVTVQAVCAKSQIAPILVSSTVYQGESAAADCPSPRLALGFGFVLDRPVDAWRVDRLLPDSTLGQVGVHASGGGPTGALTVYGICHGIDPEGSAVHSYRDTSGLVTGGGWPKTASNSPVGDGWTFGVGAVATGDGTHLDAFVARPSGDSSARAQRLGGPTGQALRRGAALAPGDAGGGGSLTEYASFIGTFH